MCLKFEVTGWSPRDGVAIQCCLACWLVPKLQLGNAVAEAPASRGPRWKQDLPEPRSRPELGNERKKKPRRLA